MLFPTLILAVLIISLVLFGAYKYKQYRARRREAVAQEQQECEREALRKDFAELLKRAEAGGAEAEQNMFEFTLRGLRLPGDDELFERYLAFRALVLNREEYADLIAKLTSLRDAWEKAQTEGSYQEKIETGVSLGRALGQLPRNHEERITAELKTTAEQIKAQLHQIITDHVSGLSERAETDPEAFFELREVLFCKNGRPSMYSERRHDENYTWIGLKLSYPDSWNEMVARYVDVPLRNEFIGTDMKDGEPPFRAAAAIRDNDLLKAQIVIACCKDDHEVREEVGDTLFAELVKLVENHDRRSATVLR